MWLAGVIRGDHANQPTDQPKSPFQIIIQGALSGHGHGNNNNNNSNNNNGYGNRDDDDFNLAVFYAESHANTSDTSLFSSALFFLTISVLAVHEEKPVQVDLNSFGSSMPPFDADELDSPLVSYGLSQ
ncbi:hypothetical protein ALT_9053 [Aspergillus lentulus]|uniref:Uncharacterized protein n=1 Tax=Aspergillus lentulus TaxID=293939 RepID=A0AAN4TEW5_ASPLE|nr:hypothetical protein ALT_9053 [Aspergillus lentulus]